MMMVSGESRWLQEPSTWAVDQAMLSGDTDSSDGGTDSLGPQPVVNRTIAHGHAGGEPDQASVEADAVNVRCARVRAAWTGKAVRLIRRPGSYTSGPPRGQTLQCTG